uniref:Uncharacterized protein n=1 Tax=Paramormyrops kingsleyae TaxID=1676925 RepID=A0A3B3SQ37_9TELE
MRALTTSDLVTLGTDQSGSHVLQAIMTSASDKERGKILRRLEVRDQGDVWNSATVSQRQDIAKELDQFACHLWAKFALTHFVKRRAQWQEIQTDQTKRKIFSDILQ